MGFLNLSKLFSRNRIDDDALDELEESLIAADVGPEASAAIVEKLKKSKSEDLKTTLKNIVEEILKPCEKPLEFSHKPHVVLMVGVNGSGKTTAIGKLAHRLKKQGKQVSLVAGDTFRAAAIEQLRKWGERAGARTFSAAANADPAGTIFDGIKAAMEAGDDVVLVDTAGRLQNKSQLMDELKKIVRVMKKIDETRPASELDFRGADGREHTERSPAAYMDIREEASTGATDSNPIKSQLRGRSATPHTTILSLDAATGANLADQVKVFGEAVQIDGLIVNKLDGTGKGGALLAIAQTNTSPHAAPLPIFFTGTGEAIDDLSPFSAEKFAKNLVG